MFSPKYKVVATKYPFTPGWQIAKRKWFFFYFIPIIDKIIYNNKNDAEWDCKILNNWKLGEIW